MKNEIIKSKQESQIIIHQTDDGITKLYVRLDNDTIWLSQKMMSELFQTTKQNISLHIQSIYDERELLHEATVKKYMTIQTEGSRNVQRLIDFYNFYMIISASTKIKTILKSF